ncbi:hypothetical protein C8T65DRAFT_527162, partial [Cerioporus squamosus]
LRAAPLRGYLIPGMNGRILTTLFADDTTVYLSAQDEYSTLEQVLNDWCVASRARFNAPKTELIPVGSKAYRTRVCASRCLREGGSPIPLTVRIVPDGAPVRLLGAWIGNEVCQKAIWLPLVNKIRANLDRWGRRKLTLKGKKLAVGIEVGSRTQYLTRVQGMPLSVVADLRKVIRHFVWGHGRTPPINEETLYLPIHEGGLDLLNLKARNEAIELIWMREYLDLTPLRPRWAYVADVMLARAVTVDSRQVDLSVRVNAFLQSWKVSMSSQIVLPSYLRDMLRVANKHRVRLDVIDPVEALRDAMPIWSH